MAFIPEAKDKDVGISVTMYNAQIIIDAFNSALKENNCMSALPVALYIEAEQHINRAEDIGVSLGGTATTINPQALNPITPIDQERERNKTTPYLLTSMGNSVKDRYQNECIDCDWQEFPELNLDKIFDNMLADIQAFIDGFFNMLNGFDTSMCHFVYLMSFICIPDLIKLLALLLGYLMKLLTPINLGLGAIMSFIMGLIGQLLSMLVSYIMSIVNWAVGPISCILKTLAEVIAGIPSADNLKKGFSPEQKQFLYDTSKGGINIDAGKSTILTPASNYLNGLNKNMNAKVDQFGDFMVGVKSDIMASLESVLSLFNILQSITDWMTCENDRSGLSIAEHLDAAMRIMQLINLIRAIIETKGNLEALDEMCNGSEARQPLNTGFTNDDLAVVIEKAFDAQAEIIESGDEIGILLTPRPKDNNLDKPTTRIELFSCNLNEFIRDAHLDKVVEHSVQFAENVLKGEGKNPSALNIPRRPLDGLTAEERARIILFADNGTEDNLKEIINEIATFNRRTQPKRKRTGINDKIVNTVPTLKEIEDNAEAVEESSLFAAIGTSESQTSIKPNFKAFNSTQEGVSKAINKPIQLKCGTIENLRDSLNSILGAT